MARHTSFPDIESEPMSHAPNAETHITTRYDPSRGELTYHWVAAGWNQFDQFLQAGGGGITELIKVLDRSAGRANRRRVRTQSVSPPRGPARDLVVTNIRQHRARHVHAAISHEIRTRSRNQMIEIGWPKGLATSSESNGSVSMRSVWEGLTQYLYRRG